MTQQILVIKHGALGDIILATGAMKAIREAHPDAQITLLTARPYDKLLAGCPFIDTIWLDSKPKLWHWRRLAELKRLLGSQRWDWAYDLQTSGRSTKYFPMFETEHYSGLHPKGSHPHDTPERKSLHTLDRLAQQLAIAGIANTPMPDVSWLKDSVEELAANAPYMMLVPGGAPHRPAKRWPTEFYAEISNILIERSFNIILIGTQAEEAILNQIAATDQRILNLMGRTSFAQIATLARNATYAVGNDTGPMHLIAAAGCPSTVIFNTNESRPEKSAPRGEHVTIGQSDDLSALSVDFVFKTVITR